jgi:formyltetrahydrofolate deformylase
VVKLSYQLDYVLLHKMIQNSGVLLITCKNRPGIVAAVSTALYNIGGDIIEAQQYDDAYTGRFFMRMMFRMTDERPAAAFGTVFSDIAKSFDMTWTLRIRSEPRKVALLVSRYDHCLVDLLYRWRNGELNIAPVAIISNHPRSTFSHIDFGDIPFHHLPVTRETKPHQEQKILRVVRESHAELVVLARYMQILSEELAREFSGRCINIHHSFLPGFKGAQPYQQAHERGVKLIGATAHFVTADLDEGPIIEQAVQPITHKDSVDTLVAKGRDIERIVLARAVALYLDDRILLNGDKTVVFR